MQAPIGSVEIIRNRLGLSEREFSAALGLGPTTYHGMVKRNDVTETVHLAAECLMRRQGRDPGDKFFLVRLTRGILHSTPLEATSLQHITLNGKRFLLVPEEGSDR